MRLVVLSILVACSSDAPAPGTTTGLPTTTSPTTGTTTPTTTSALPDEALVRDLLGGAAPLDEVWLDVAWSGGWPVETAAGTWLFVVADDSGTWQLAGDHDGWTGAAMTSGGGFQWIEVEVPEPQGSGYKFVAPDGAWLADPWARSYEWDANGELSFVRPPTDRARLDRWPQLEAEGLAPRDLRVHAPPGSGPWPVLYMHDGQNLFSPEAIWGGWRMTEALAGRPDAVVVGIDNTADRFDEYTHTTDEVFGTVYGGDAAAYARMVGDHVRPHVETVYGSTGHDGVMGSSLGGLVSLVIANEQPGEWDFVGSMSGTLGWGRLELANPVIDEVWTAAPGAFVLYLDSGGDAGPDGLCTDPNGDGYPADDPDSSDNYCETRQFADARAAEGWTWGVDLHHWHEVGATHDELAWADRVGLPLDLFLAP